jgi:tripartite-type tricarboxylate transporter receptor subunit TctC
MEVDEGRRPATVAPTTENAIGKKRTTLETARIELGSSDWGRRNMRRLKLCGFAGLLAVVGLAGAAFAQDPAADYPNRVVRLVVPFTPGASTDAVARLIGQKLSEAWGRQVIVDNRPGAGGGLGAEMVVRAEPDGTTLMVTNQGPSIFNALLRKNAPYAIADLAPVVEFGSTPLIIVANPKFPPNDVKAMIAYAKANPGKVHVGSSGTNSNLHIALEMLKAATSAEITHVPYRGTGPALNDVVAGTIEAAYTTTVSAAGLIESGQLKVLGVAGAKRLDVIPKVATFAEQGIGNANAALWIGLVAPAKTPRPIIDKVNREVNKALQSTDVRTRFGQWGLEVEGGTPDDFAKVIKAEADRVGALLRAKALQVQ